MVNKINLVEKLEECGCCKELIEQIRCCTKDHEILNILKKGKKYYQFQFDKACKQIDVIDYLMYQMEKETS